MYAYKIIDKKSFIEKTGRKMKKQLSCITSSCFLEE